MRQTHALVQVALALMEKPDARHWGYDLAQRAGLRSGVLYPVLHRMLDHGWLRDGWEEGRPGLRGRPPRRYYELTAVGADELRAVLDEGSRDRRFQAILADQTW